MDKSINASNSTETPIIDCICYQQGPEWYFIKNVLQFQPRYKPADQVLRSVNPTHSLKTKIK